MLWVVGFDPNFHWTTQAVAVAQLAVVIGVIAIATVGLEGYYYRKVPSPITPNGDDTEDANETTPSILGER